MCWWCEAPQQACRLMRRCRRSAPLARLPFSPLVLTRLKPNVASCYSEFLLVWVHPQEPRLALSNFTTKHTHTQTGLGLTMERLLEEVASHCTPARELEDQLVLRPWPGHGAPGLCSLPCSVVGNAEFTVIAVWCYFVLPLRRQRRA